MIQGCATPIHKKYVTIHDYCTKHLDRYQNYEECYCETKSRRKQERIDNIRAEQQRNKDIDSYVNSFKQITNGILRQNNSN
jgi:hypothetical protein